MLKAFIQPVDYKQSDPRWGNIMYSNHGDPEQTMDSSGCGPTAMADIVATLVDPAVTPWDLAQKALEWGVRTHSEGTDYSFFGHAASEYCFSRMEETASIKMLKACLDEGGYVVCSMGKGYWTKGGHYICVWKYDEAFIYANDPASETRVRQPVPDFMKESKAYFCFWK